MSKNILNTLSTTSIMLGQLVGARNTDGFTEHLKRELQALPPVEAQKAASDTRNALKVLRITLAVLVQKSKRSDFIQRPKLTQEAQKNQQAAQPLRKSPSEQEAIQVATNKDDSTDGVGDSPSEEKDGDARKVATESPVDTEAVEPAVKIIWPGLLDVPSTQNQSTSSTRSGWVSTVHRGKRY